MLPHVLRAAGRDRCSSSAARWPASPATGCSGSCSAIYGFILGAMLASSMMGISNTTGMMVGGARRRRRRRAAVLVFAYFVGIALVGAGLGALVAHVAWATFGTGDPPAVAVIVLAICGRDRRDGAAALRDHRRDRVRAAHGR